MNCFDSYIGLDQSAEESGLRLLDLPGITITNFQAIKETSATTNQSLWDKLTKRAQVKFATACMARINECYRINDTEIISCLVCEKKQLFATAFWYLLGVETMIERMFSDRANRWTTLDRQEASELQGYYQTQFENELGFAVMGLSPKDSDCISACVPCNASVRFEEVSL